MDCERLTDQLLQAYMDGELDDPTMSQIREHLNACPHCKERYNKAMKAVETLRKAFHVPSPDGLSEKILTSIRRRNIRRRTVIALAASLVLMIGLVLFTLPRVGEEITRTETPIQKETFETVKRNRLPEKKPQKGLEAPSKERRALVERIDVPNIYLVFPSEGDVLEETGEIVFYLEENVDSIIFNIDGVVYMRKGGKAGDIITIPFKAEEEGPHNLKVVKPIETAVVFYSLGEG